MLSPCADTLYGLGQASPCFPFFSWRNGEHVVWEVLRVCKALAVFNEKKKEKKISGEACQERSTEQ